jgi:hypothetical protein
MVHDGMTICGLQGHEGSFKGGPKGTQTMTYDALLTSNVLEYRIVDLKT